MRCLGFQEAFGSLRTRLCGLHCGYTGSQVGRAPLTERANNDRASRVPMAEDAQARKASATARAGGGAHVIASGNATTARVTAMRRCSKDDGVIAALEGALTSAIRAGAESARALVLIGECGEGPAARQKRSERRTCSSVHGSSGTGRAGTKTKGTKSKARKQASCGASVRRASSGS